MTYLGRNDERVKIRGISLADLVGDGELWEQLHELPFRDLRTLAQWQRTKRLWAEHKWALRQGGRSHQQYYAG